jgi:hypothetical protein
MSHPRDIFGAIGPRLPTKTVSTELGYVKMNIPVKKSDKRKEKLSQRQKRLR